MDMIFPVAAVFAETRATPLAGASAFVDSFNKDPVVKPLPSFATSIAFPSVKAFASMDMIFPVAAVFAETRATPLAGAVDRVDTRSKDPSRNVSLSVLMMCIPSPDVKRSARTLSMVPCSWFRPSRLRRFPPMREMVHVLPAPWLPVKVGVLDVSSARTSCTNSCVLYSQNVSLLGVQSMCST